MSVFIALIAESYQIARDQLHTEQTNMISRSPATGAHSCRYSDVVCSGSFGGLVEHCA